MYSSMSLEGGGFGMAWERALIGLRRLLHPLPRYLGDFNGPIRLIPTISSSIHNF